MKIFKINLLGILCFLCYQQLNAQVIDESKIVIETPNKSCEIGVQERIHNGTPIDFMLIGHTDSNKPIFIDQNGQVSIGSIDPCLRNYGSGAYLVVEGDAVKPDDGMWTTTSDERLKTDILALGDSRGKFLRVKIYRFTYKKSGKIRYGIIAQQVKDMYPNSMGTFEEGGVEYLTFNPNNLFYEGMKVIQENAEDIIKHEEQIRTLAAENQRLRAELEAQQSRLDAIEAALANQGVDIPRPTTGETDAKPVTSTINIITEGDVPQLRQNIPNPFSQFTTIPYYLPDNTRTATLVISDMTGKIIAKHILPTQKGAGKIEVDTEDTQLQGGTFTYSLYINETLIDTKKMVLLSK